MKMNISEDCQKFGLEIMNFSSMISVPIAKEAKNRLTQETHQLPFAPAKSALIIGFVMIVIRFMYKLLFTSTKFDKLIGFAVDNAEHLFILAVRDHISNVNYL